MRASGYRPNNDFTNQTVEERTYEEGQNVILERKVTRGHREVIYKKVTARYGTFYFRGGTAISEYIWARETGGK